VFAGEPGPVRDAVALNAAAALAAHAGLSGDLRSDLRAALERASTAMDSGACARLLDDWVALSGRLAAAT
jgi:anthranilate phosphoribosyltransferase